MCIRDRVITVDPLKPAFGFADPAPQTTEKRKEVKAAPPKKEIKRPLNPEAESFVPGRKPKEKTPVVFFFFFLCYEIHTGRVRG